MESKNLWQRIADVMKEVQYLQKDDKVGFGNSSYKAISEEKVTETLRASLIKNGLVILPVEQQHFREDTILKDEAGKEKLNRLSTVNTKYKIVNIDNPSEFEYLVSSGTGVDTQDKGVGKAMTYSYKYMLLRTFAIPTGEDPDKVSSEELDQQLIGKPNTLPLDMQASKLSEKQVNRAIMIGKSKGVSVEQIKKGILRDYKKHEIADLTKSEYDELCSKLESIEKGA